MNRVWRALSGRSGLIIAWVLALAGCRDGDELGRAKPPGQEDGPPATPEVVMEPEAGFVEVRAGRLTDPVAHRLFYSFFPAEAHPEEAPVLVFFNGGPGSATTGFLWVFGTAPYMLDPSATSEAELQPIENPFPYTRFANLLYIDARGAGFSYDRLRTEEEHEPASGLEGDSCYGGTEELFHAASCSADDAADFVEVLLEFVDGHPALTDNAVVLVGESYGGNRALMILQLLQHYAAGSPEAGVPDYGCYMPQLRERVQAHFDRVSPEDEGRPRTPREVARQFGWQVLIQPGLRTDPAHDDQAAANDPDLRPYLADPDYDAYDVRRNAKAGSWMEAMAGVAIAKPESLALLMGMAPEEVPLLTPGSGRGSAFRSFVGFGDAPAPQTSLHDRLGALDPGDAYWLPFVSNMDCDVWMDAPALYEVSGRTRTFITNAKYDRVVWTDAIRAKIERERGAEHDTASPDGAVRPGVIRFDSDDGIPVEIRFPEYEAGHVVTAGQPREFGEDVEAWLRATGAIRE